MNPLLIFVIGYVAGRMITPMQARQAVEKVVQEAQGPMGYVTASLGGPQAQVQFRGAGGYGPGSKAKNLMQWYPG